MNDLSQFKAFVKKIAWKNKAALPGLDLKEIEAECWTALILAIYRWDGAKGKLSSWIYTAVTGRMKDLRKRPARMEIYLENMDFFGMGEDLSEKVLENMDLAAHPFDDRCNAQNIFMEISQRN
jgi:hypothetical protein